MPIVILKVEIDNFLFYFKRYILFEKKERESLSLVEQNELV